MANTYTETARRAAHPDPLTAGLPLSRRDRPAGDPAGDAAGTWRDLALCAQVDPEMFFPEKGASNADARRVCGGCAVRVECLAEATDDKTVGVWGGSSDKERQALRREGWTGDRIKAYAAATGGEVPLVTKGGRAPKVLPWRATQAAADTTTAAA